MIAARQALCGGLSAFGLAGWAASCAPDARPVPSSAPAPDGRSGTQPATVERSPDKITL